MRGPLTLKLQIFYAERRMVVKAKGKSKSRKVSRLEWPRFSHFTLPFFYNGDYSEAGATLRTLSETPSEYFLKFSLKRRARSLAC